MKIFCHLGNRVPDYRGIMKDHTDFMVGNKKIPASRVVIAEQTHSDQAHICTEADCGAGFHDHPQIATADALITDIPGQYLLIRTADCTPILLHDRKGSLVAAIHSGREGTRKNIPGKTVKAIADNFGIYPEDLKAWIGAGICQRHYEVDAATWDAFSASLQDQGIEPDMSLPRHIDIPGCIFQQLTAAGIPSCNIGWEQICTFESPLYFSWRRDATNNRQINLIGLEYE